VRAHKVDLDLDAIRQLSDDALLTVVAYSREYEEITVCEAVRTLRERAIEPYERPLVVSTRGRPVTISGR
jgi:hypothetical protein